MQSSSVVSNGTNVREDKTEVPAGCREVALCLPIDLGLDSRKVGGGVRGAFALLAKTYHGSRVTEHRALVSDYELIVQVMDALGGL
jgi:hypothetical protein